MHMVSTIPWTLERVYDRLPAPHTRQRHMGAQLPGGEQQRLAMGRGLMTPPRPLFSVRLRRPGAALTG